MQPSPTTSMDGVPSRKLRVGVTVLHAALLVSLIALGACRDPKVATYRVPKEAGAELPVSQPIHGEMAAASTPPASAPQTPAMPAMPGASDPAGTGAGANPHTLQTASGPSLTWTAPGDWQAKPASMMRKATYTVTGAGGATADLAVSAFPGDVGGDVANVNRWRGQVGLNAVSDAEALASIQALEVNGLKIGVVDVVDTSSPNATHLLGAMVPFQGSTWFFKLLGPDAVVAAQKPAFLAFLKTVKPAAATP